MKWLPLHLRRQLHLAKYVHDIINEKCPKQFIGMFQESPGSTRGATSRNLYIEASKSHKTFTYLGALCWNKIPCEIRNIEDQGRFKKFYKMALMGKLYSDTEYKTNNGYDFFYPCTEI